MLPYNIEMPRRVKAQLSYHLVTRKHSRQRKTILWPPCKIWHRTGCLWRPQSLQTFPSSHQDARRGSCCQSNCIQIHLKILPSMSHSMKSLYSPTLPYTASAREAPTLRHFGANMLRSPYLPYYSAAVWPKQQQPPSAAQLLEQHHLAAQRPVNIQATIWGSFAPSHLMLWLDCAAEMQTCIASGGAYRDWPGSLCTLVAEGSSTILPAS